MTRREAFLWYIERMLFTPYGWGGDDPWKIDCSGLVVFGLTAVGVWPWATDRTAQDIAEWGRNTGRSISEVEIEPGDLVLFLNSAGRATHVEVLWREVDGSPRLSIGASGGGSGHTASTPDAAAVQASATNAFVKLAPWRRRPGPYLFVDPFMPGRADV